MIFEKQNKKQGFLKPSKEEIEFVNENATVIYKSFDRKNMAKQLYKNLQDYYPGIKIIIADDSSVPFDLQGETLEVIQLPFNSGLSYGLNRALEKVKTPYVMRMDDELLTQRTFLGDQIYFLKNHPEIDLIGFCILTSIRCENPDKEISTFTKFNMAGAPKPLKIPRMTQIDGNHFVMGKVPNIYVPRTEKEVLDGMTISEC